MRDLAWIFVRPDVKSLTDSRERLLPTNGFQCAFPDADQIPAEFSPFDFVLVVTPNVIVPLVLPERDIGFWHRTGGTSMTMPEATSHLDQRVGTRDDNIGMPGETLVAGAKPPSSGKKAFTNE